MVGVQMGEEDGGDISRRDTGCSQRAGQQPSCGNRLRRIREPGRGGNIAGERDGGRPEARVHKDGQTLCLDQEAPHGDVVCPIGLQEFRMGAEVKARVVHGRQVNLAVVQSADLDAADVDDCRQQVFLPGLMRNSAAEVPQGISRQFSTRTRHIPVIAGSRRQDNGWRGQAHCAHQPQAG